MFLAWSEAHSRYACMHTCTHTHTHTHTHTLRALLTNINNEIRTHTITHITHIQSETHCRLHTYIHTHIHADKAYVYLLVTSRARPCKEVTRDKFILRYIRITDTRTCCTYMRIHTCWRRLVRVPAPRLPEMRNAT